MWIVLEGIDGSGKTHTAEKVIRNFPKFQYRHVGPPGGQAGMLDGAWPALAQSWYNEPHGNVVWDRGHLGELVYGPDRGFRPDENGGWLRLLEAILCNRFTAVLWLARDPRTAHREGLTSRSLDELLVHHYRFAALCESDSYLALGPTVMEGETGPDAVIRQVEEALERARQHESRHQDTEGVGTNTPGIWVLGEQRSPAAWCPAPFATPSGVELVWPLVNSLVVRVSNVARPDWDLRAVRGTWCHEWRDDLYGRWASLGEPQVITLGHTAERACGLSRVPVHVALDHPQYSRRFYYSQAPQYRERFAAALRSAAGLRGTEELAAVMSVQQLVRTLLGQEDAPA